MEVVLRSYQTNTYYIFKTFHNTRSCPIMDEHSMIHRLTKPMQPYILLRVGNCMFSKENIGSRLQTRTHHGITSPNHWDAWLMATDADASKDQIHTNTHISKITANHSSGRKTEIIMVEIDTQKGCRVTKAHNIMHSFLVDRCPVSGQLSDGR